MNTRDTELLYENYRSINVKQLMLESTVKDFIKNTAQIDTLSEALAILDIHNDLVNEGLFGGLSNVAKGVGGTLQRGAQAVGQGVRNIGNTVNAAGQAVVKGARQVRSNIGNMYTSGSNAQEASKVMEQAATAAQQLRDLLLRAKKLAPELFVDSRGKPTLASNPDGMRLSQIISYLTNTQSTTANTAQAARDRGVFGGVGGAMADAYSSAAAPATP